MFPGSGNGRCGDGDVRFFNSCGVPDGWQQLEELFLGTFRNNPDTTFPENTD